MHWDRSKKTKAISAKKFFKYSFEKIYCIISLIDKIYARFHREISPTQTSFIGHYEIYKKRNNFFCGKFKYVEIL